MNQQWRRWGFPREKLGNNFQSGNLLFFRRMVTGCQAGGNSHYPHQYCGWHYREHVTSSLSLRGSYYVQRKVALHIRQWKKYIIINEVNYRCSFTSNRIHFNTWSRYSEVTRIIPGRARELGLDATNKNKAARKSCCVAVGTKHQKLYHPLPRKNKKALPPGWPEHLTSCT